MNKKRVFIVAFLLLLLGILGWFLYQRYFIGEEVGENNERVSQGENSGVIAQNLNVPWEVVFQDEKFYVTERTGILKILQDEGQMVSEIAVDNVTQIGEGGLLGLALDPDFTQNRQLYLYKTTGSGNTLKNIVERYVLDGDRLTQRQVIVDNIPASSNHNGGRIKFGPDNFLYITTGDASRSELAQDRESLAGKILRVNKDGTAAAENPFNSRVYALGLRNPQGLAWDDQDKLWATDHGPSARDEINLIESGKNYGWPLITGDQSRQGLESPKIHSGQNTWAPAGIVFKDDKLYFGGLRGSNLFSVEIQNSNLVNLKTELGEDYGRIRAVTSEGDNIIFATSNRDGRGRIRRDDDKIIRR